MTPISGARNVKDSKASGLSLSTMWASGRFANMVEFAARAEALGFDQVEPNAWLTPRRLRELIESGIPISSIHSPCPAVPSSRGDGASSLLLSSLDESERREAVSFAERTVDLASSVGAAAIVLHMGEAPVDRSLQAELSRLHSAGLSGSEDYRHVKDELLYRRASAVAPHFEAARRSLLELSEYSGQRGIVLGVETRFHVHEIPDMDEMGHLLKEAPADTVGYWHDVGHAEVQQRLGVGRHEEWLARFKKRMVGIHLHDVVGVSDHYAPGKGEIDWKMVAGYLTPGSVKVCEIGEWNDEEQLRGVIDFLKNQGIAG